jgi:hypothetical protein
LQLPGLKESLLRGRQYNHQGEKGRGKERATSTQFHDILLYGSVLETVF